MICDDSVVNVVYADDENRTFLLSGSVAELPLLYVFTNFTDVDVMKVPRDICASDRTNGIETRIVNNNGCDLANNRREILIIENSPDHPCFLKLWSSRRHRYFKKPSTRKLNVAEKIDTPNGPSFKRNLFQNPKAWYGGLFEQFASSMSFKKLIHASKDNVFAIECLSWPLAVKEWICRKREHNWPSKKCVEQVVEGSCHVVAKPHDSNIGDDTEWRFSFSKAEIVLIHTWTAKQKHVYHILRLIKSELVRKMASDSRKVLSTYFIKTLMLWKCEDLRQEFWARENLEGIICKLLLFYIEWLIDKQCLSYFIPGYNMWEYVPDDGCFEEVISLIMGTIESLSDCVYLQEWRMPEVNENSHLEQLNENTENFLINAGWYIVSYCTTLPLSNFILSVEQYGKISVEYLKLCDGLAWNIRWSSEDRKPEEFYREAQDCYRFSDATRTCSASDPLFIPMAVMHLSISELFETLLHNTIHMNDSSELKQTVSLGCKSELSGETSFYNEDMILLNLSMTRISSILPPALYFISRAYQVNMMYMHVRTYKDYREVVDLCSEAVEVSDQLMPEPFEEIRDGPVQFPLNTEWSIIYDRQIQTILGFMSLTRHLASRQDGAPQVTPLCPVLFMLYIRLKCLLKLGEPRDTVQLVHHSSVCHYENAFSCKILLLAYRLTLGSFLTHKS